MKIGFIARGLTNGGVTRYIENALKTFNDDYPTECSVVLFTDREDFKDEYKNIEVVYIKMGVKLFWDLIKVFWYLYKFELDVVIYPKDIIPLSHSLFRFKKINIIHDLAYFDKKLNQQLIQLPL